MNSLDKPSYLKLRSDSWTQLHIHQPGAIAACVALKKENIIVYIINVKFSRQKYEAQNIFTSRAMQSLLDFVPVLKC